jgi:aminobenzoyl-glutamate utilization protein B
LLVLSARNLLRYLHKVIKEDIMRRAKAFLVVSVFLLAIFVVASTPLSARQPTPAVRTAISWIDDNKAAYDGMASFLWENPELSLAEFKSSGKLQGYLAANGFRIEKGVAEMPTAFVATWGLGKPVVGILGEFDALPSLSQRKGVASQVPVVPGAPGHGCGHNLFGPASATAAVAMAKAMEKHGIKGTVKFFGTPAEETLVGKVYMNRDGVFDGTDIMIAWHPMDINGVDYSSSLAMDNIKFRFYGKASHAAVAPDAGRSALDAVELMDVGANFMREHVPQEARIHYIISKGGEAPNVVPPFAEAWYFIRAPRRAEVDRIRAWLIDISKGAALMTQTTTDYRILTAVYEYLPNRTLAKMGDEVVKMVGAPAFTAEEQAFGGTVLGAMGRKAESEAFSTKVTTPDFARTFPDVPNSKASTDVNFTWRFPSVQFFTATLAKGTPLHSWMAVCQTGTSPAMKAGLQVSKYMAAMGLEVLTNPALVTEAWAELGENVARFGYREPVPKEVKVPTFKELYGIEPSAVPESAR